MHELPSDLTNSLRSFRGSIYGNARTSIQRDGTDTDEVRDVNNDEERRFDQALRATRSSLILHPTKSQRAMSQARAAQRQDDDLDRDLEKGSQLQRVSSQHELQQWSNPLPGGLSSDVGKQDPQTPVAHKQSVFQAPPVADPDPAADRLDDDETPLSAAHFHELMGLKLPGSRNVQPQDLYVKHGLYEKIVAAKNYVHYKYKAFSVLAYFLLTLQLLLGALFIILGSLRALDTHTSIPVLGAISTLVAGSLALMQGQGLPSRLRHTRNGLRNVIFEAEELYWDFQADRSVLFRDIKQIREDFLRVVEDERKNHPDTWNATSNIIAQGLSKKAARGKGGKG